MSGGIFDYAYLRIDGFSEQLGRRINGQDNDSQGSQRIFQNELTLERLREIHELCIFTSNLMMEVELLYSQDISEEDFLSVANERISRDEAESSIISCCLQQK